MIFVVTYFDSNYEKYMYHEPLVASLSINVSSASPAIADSLFNFTLRPNVSFSNVRLLLLVISAPGEFKRRQWIRSQSWGIAKHLEKYEAALVFVVGEDKNHSFTENLKEENEAFRDLLLDSYLEDSYVNLTRKVLSALYWTSIQPWKRLRYIAKIDSDTFINMRLLFKTSETMPHDSPCILGHVFVESLVVRVHGHKWYVSKAVYPQKYFPKYANGPSYVINRNAIPRLISLETLLDLRDRRELFLEDVYITGILRQRYGIELRNVDSFCFPMPVALHKKRLQKSVNKYISIHSVNEKDFEYFRNIIR